MLQRHWKWGESETQTRINAFWPSPSTNNIKLFLKKNNWGSSNPGLQLFLFLYGFFLQKRYPFYTRKVTLAYTFNRNWYSFHIFTPSKNTSVKKPLGDSTRPFWKPKWQFSLPFFLCHIVNSQPLFPNPLRVDPSGSVNHRVYTHAIVQAFLT